MELFKYSQTLKSLKESGELERNYMNLNWKLILCEFIVAHNFNQIEVPLKQFIKNMKVQILSYCGNPDDLKVLLEDIH